VTQDVGFEFKPQYQKKEKKMRGWEGRREGGRKGKAERERNLWHQKLKINLSSFKTVSLQYSIIPMGK
jgi:hypothetical protein